MIQYMDKKTVLGTFTMSAVVFMIMLFVPSGLYGRDKEDQATIPFRYEVRAGWGGFPLWDAFVFNDASDPAFSSLTTLSSLYADYNGDVYMTGTISTEFVFHFKKWFSLALGMGYNGIFSTTYSSDTGARTGMDCGAVVSFLPQVRFSYLNRDYVRLYSSIGAGMSLGAFAGSAACMLSFQMVPIGVTVGKKVFGFFETGIGTQYVGCMAGIGFRF